MSTTAIQNPLNWPVIRVDGGREVRQSIIQSRFRWSHLRTERYVDCVEMDGANIRRWREWENP